MSGPFARIGIFSKPSGNEIAETLEHLIKFLLKRKHQVIVEEVNANNSLPKEVTVLPAHKIGHECDLILVIGGDGSMLKAARAIVDYQVPIIGINRGTLGFLADINPQQLEESLTSILDGKYIEERRTILNAKIIQGQETVAEHLAINDVVLHHGDIARLIEFEVFINDQFVLDQRSDGLITATPTGSTAYALSGGGPIIYPSIDVICLVPMFPHTLSTRPIVVSNTSKIRLVISKHNKFDAKLSCDGQMHMSLSTGDEVHIQAHKNAIRLLHPRSYDYYSVLREKLGWNQKMHK